jgi:hypothetical protein
MSFCTKCGHRLAGYVPFCTGCGARRSAAEAARRPRRRRLPGGGPAAAAVAVIMAVSLSVLLTWRLNDQRTGPAPEAGRTPRPTISTGHDRAPPSAISAAPAGSASAAAAPAGAVPIGAGAARQPGAGQVAAFLGSYFAAINDRDYLTYISLFDGPARPDHDEQQFLDGYSTTTDVDPVLVALTPTAAGGWAATVTFASHQSPAASATHSSCTSWEITLYLEPSGNSYLIGLPPPDYHASRTAC